MLLAVHVEHFSSPGGLQTNSDSSLKIALIVELDVQVILIVKSSGMGKLQWSPGISPNKQKSFLHRSLAMKFDIFFFQVLVLRVEKNLCKKVVWKSFRFLILLGLKTFNHVFPLSFRK